MESDLLSQIREGGLLYIVLLIGITMHEFGHAYVADKLGDFLPRAQGRVTVNPIAHIDVIGTVVLPILMIGMSISSGSMMIFGWGKPVQVALSNPKTRMKVDLLSTLGGVGANLVLGLIFGIFLAIFALFDMKEFAGFAALSIMVNSMLFVINMIPIPPLDGSHFLKYAVRMSDETYAMIARYGIIIFIVLINFPMTSQIIGKCVHFVSSIFLYEASLIIQIVK